MCPLLSVSKSKEVSVHLIAGKVRERFDWRAARPTWTTTHLFTQARGTTIQRLESEMLKCDSLT